MAQDRTGMVLQELSEDEIKKRSAKLAKEELERDELIEKKRSHNRAWNEELKQLGVSISVLSAEVDSGQAWVSVQEPMFDGDGVVNDDEPEPPRRRGRRRSAPAEDGNLGDAA